jgi:PAS domain S-box-containing protein
MAKPNPTGKEVFFEENEIIVSKTDTSGKIIYANDVFYKVSGYEQHEVIGMPHSFVRHPSMPRSVFKLLWESIQSGNEIFAYVVNLAKNGDHYWVFAHVTPTFNVRGDIIGFHSNRRSPERDGVEKFEALYKMLCAEEQKYTDKKKAIEASSKILQAMLREQNTSYEELVFQGAY